MKLPIKYLIQAKAAVMDAAEEFTKIDVERRNDTLTYEDTLRLKGEEGAEEWIKRRKRFEAAERKVTLEAQERIKKATESYIKAVSDQIIPNGEDLQCPDYVCLRDGVVETEQALQELLARNNNYAFVSAAAKYAKDRNWGGFENNWDITAGRFLDYGKSFLDDCHTAAENPLHSYYSMLVLNDAELGRRAASFSILNEYNDAGGAGK